MDYCKTLLFLISRKAWVSLVCVCVCFWTNMVLDFPREGLWKICSQDISQFVPVAVFKETSTFWSFLCNKENIRRLLLYDGIINNEMVRSGLMQSGFSVTTPTLIIFLEQHIASCFIPCITNNNQWVQQMKDLERGTHMYSVYESDCSRHYTLCVVYKSFSLLMWNRSRAETRAKLSSSPSTKPHSLRASQPLKTSRLIDRKWKLCFCLLKIDQMKL